MSRLLLSSVLVILMLAAIRPSASRADLIKLDLLLRACAGKSAITRADCSGYIAGITDALEEQHAICLPAGAELKSVRELVVGYLQSHKQEPDTKAATAVGEALKAGYACKQ